MTSRPIKSAAALAALALVAATVTVAPGSSAATDAASAIAATQTTAMQLLAPYSGWDVTVTPLNGQAGAVDVAYNSPALGIRSDNSVYLPTDYSTTGVPLPVMYYLHGTVLPPIDNPALAPITAEESLLDMVSAGGGEKQTELEDFPSQESKAHFLVVAPDTNTQHSWCETCLWINGQPDLLPAISPITAKTVPAETVLYDEVIPLIQQLFNVRTDRGGRGVIGFSMGGMSALLQGFRHPDLYSYIGSISGLYDMVDDPILDPLFNGLGYFRDQGYGTSLTNLTMWRNFNPSDLISNVVGSGNTLMLSAGDQCLPPTDAEGLTDCAKYPPLRNPLAATIETLLRINNDVGAKMLATSGVPADEVRFSGIHGANNHRVYAEVIVPQANAAFASTVTTSDTFSYRTADSNFAVWGYSVAVSRPTPAFLGMEGASHDGTHFALRGNGTVTVQTPTTFTPGSTYSVSVDSATGHVSTSTVTADSSGRLRINVDLNNRSFATASALTSILTGPTPNYATVTISPV